MGWPEYQKANTRDISPQSHARLRQILALASLWMLASLGCGFGPRSLVQTRIAYNEAVKTTSEEQFLLNIVRLRYTNTPSSLAISNIADQQELASEFQAIPFFLAGAADGFRSQALPQASLSRASRPTLSYTPLDDEEYTQRLFAPISLNGALYLSRTTWPISTVFRLYLENLDWISNAETASGPTPIGITSIKQIEIRKPPSRCCWKSHGWNFSPPNPTLRFLRFRLDATAKHESNPKQTMASGSLSDQTPCKRRKLTHAVAVSRELHLPTKRLTQRPSSDD